MFSVFVRLKICYVIISANDLWAIKEVFLEREIYMSYADLEGIHGIEDQ